MNSLRGISPTLLAALLGNLAAAGPVIREGDAWRYYKGRTSAPPLQGAYDWTDVEYDDSSGWGGPAPSGFGYGDGDDATVFTDMNTNVNGYVTLYTRRAFTIADTSTVTHLTLAADYDDGFVAYINGQEVARGNMPVGPVSHTTTAAGAREASRSGQDSYTCNCDPQEKEFISLDPGVLRSGTNVLAVSGHNASSNSSDFSLIVELYTNVTLVRGPILQMPRPGQVSVLWRTDAPLDSVVEYGPDPNVAWGVVSNAGPTRFHEVLLPSFDPGTTVHYRAWSGGAVVAADRFRAPKAPGQPLRIALMSDYGSPSTNTVAVAAQVLAQDPDLLVTSGDNVQQQSAPPGLFDSDWFGPLAPLLARMPMMASLGNHDIRIAQGAWYLDALSLPTNGPPGLAERNYSFAYGDTHFTILDANAFVPDADTTYDDPAAQRALILPWLTNELHHATQMWKFVSYHHPPYTSRGSHGGVALMQQQLSPVFEHYGVNVAFQGHNHMYERINPINGVNYITVGSGGFSIHSLIEQGEFSANVFRDAYDFVLLDIEGPRLLLRCIDQAGVERDRLDLDLSHPFAIDGRLDSTNWLRAANGMNLHAAIRGRHLYVATQDAGEGSDHFLYLHNTASTMRPANWAKSGQVMQWGAFLSDENGGNGATPGFNGWFGPQQQILGDASAYRSVTPGLNNNGTNGNGVLEGTLDLVSHFGSFPPTLWLAAAPFATSDGGAMVAPSQVPAGDGDGDVEPSEYLVVDTRGLALDLPVADAAAPTAEEAGVWVPLDGSASLAPSALPLSFSWSASAPPDTLFSNAGLPLAAFRLLQNPGSAVTVPVSLVVNDTRFDSTSMVSVVFHPMVDSDGDGLSDGEEATGIDNAFTGADPAGRTSHVFFADSDGDGSGDGEEAVAGTSPNDAASLLRVVFAPGAFDTNLTILWPGVTNRRYGVLRGVSPGGPYAPWKTNIPAVDPLNSATVPVSDADFITIRVEP